MKKRILIVEDNITLSQIVKDWLEREGYAVATAIDEPYARKLLRKESFDLILSDVRLPQGDGISLLEWINKEKMDIPFVIMTEYASVTDAVKAIKMGAKDYLAKPVFHEQLVEMVKELLKPVSTVRSKDQAYKPQGYGSYEYGGVGCSIGYFSIDSRSKRNRQRVHSTKHSLP